MQHAYWECIVLHVGGPEAEHIGDRDWPVANAVDLRTMTKLDARKLQMKPLDIRVIEVCKGGS